MKFGQRLAAMQRVRAPDPAPVSAPEPAVWTRSWTFATGTAPELGEAAPRGFDPLILPDADAVHRGLAELLPAPPAATDVPVVVVDLETSGLGTACIPFIVALAWHDRPDRVRLQQWSIDCAASERALLCAVVDRLASIATGDTHLLSFNGRSFDVPRLCARMARLAVDDRGVLQRPHVDLVHPSRRLFKGCFDDCRLGTLERRVLGLQRHGDLEGWEIAGLLPELERDPNDAWIVQQREEARRHNRGDVLSLLALVSSAAQRIVAPTGASESLRVARHLVALDRFGEAADRLAPHVERSLQQGDAAVEARELVMLAADLERRQGHFDAAASLWAWVCEHFPGDVQAHEALAKHLEHRERDPGRALAVAAASSSPCAHRLARLRRKVGPAPKV